MENPSKLGFLMNITRTRNSQLADALVYDPSYISRIRCGRRSIPQRPNFIEPMAEYFAERIIEPIQTSAAASVICPNAEWPNTVEGAREVIAAWLREESRNTSKSLREQFVSDVLSIIEKSGALSADKPKVKRACTSDAPKVESPFKDSTELRITFGDQGKRDAVAAFLEQLAQAKGPCELMLSSDEDLSWLRENSPFATRWIELINLLVNLGATIRVIHSCNHDDESIFGSMRMWLPIYLSGNVESYYCPKNRDGIFRRTTFVAKDLCALVSQSVMDMTDDMPNFVVSNVEVVRAVEKQFDAYQSICEPAASMHAVDGIDGLRAFVTKLSETGTSLRAYADTRETEIGSVRVTVIEGTAVAFSSVQNPAKVLTLHEAHIVSAFWDSIGAR